jgi:type VI secretion system protein ImpF
VPTADPPATGLLPSVFDRLLDPMSMGSVASAQSASPGGSLAAITEAVRRDVEELLNNRRPVDAEADRFPELSRSVFAYGLPELISLPAVTGPQRDAIARLVAEAVTRHEPRLRDVRATIVGSPDPTDRTIKLRIDGRLRLSPAPGVQFETVLQLAAGQTAVVKRSV